MQSNLAFIIKELKNDQFSLSIVNAVSDFIDNRPLNNIAIFTSSCDTIDTKRVPILHISHAGYFNAKIIALDFESLLFSSIFIQKKELIYYATNLPWTEKVYRYSELKRLFMPDNTNRIISSSRNIARFYNKFFGQQEYIVDNLTYGNLYEKIQ